MSTPPPDPARVKTTADLVLLLRVYKAWAGNPSLRDMAAATGNRVSASGLANLTRLDRLPKLGSVMYFLAACGSAPEYREAVTEAWRRLAVQRLGPEAAALLESRDDRL